jgi:hypothetical protein
MPGVAAVAAGSGAMAGASARAAEVNTAKQAKMNANLFILA